MSQEGMMEYDSERAAQQAEAEVEVGQEHAAPMVSPEAATSMLSKPLAGVQRRAIVESVGQHFGNRQVQRMLGTVRRSASAGAEGGPLEDNLTQTIQGERSKGTPMDAGIRTQVEGSLGHDLSPVRVHTDSTSHELNRQMGAKAFTTGRDIFYGEGQSPSDLELTTHESTHTIQQGMSEAAPSSIGAADTAHEHAAEHNATHQGAGGVQRDSADEDEVAMKRDDSVQREAEGDEDEVALKRDDTVQREAEGDEDEVALKRDDSVQREAEDDEEVQMKRDDSVQREAEDDEEVQMKRDDSVQREGEDDEEAA